MGAPQPLASPIAGLRSLYLSSNRLTRLPPALSAATALTTLCLRWNDELRLSRADEQLLAALPLLPDATQRLREQLRQPRRGSPGLNAQRCRELMGAVLFFTIILSLFVGLPVLIGVLHRDEGDGSSSDSAAAAVVFIPAIE